ncbi:MAG: preprotein translocase subunit Sec61beta [Candidatus Altarchaeaceae archaeon]
MARLRRIGGEGPASVAGIIRYFDVDEGGPKLEPLFVIGVIVAVIIIEIAIGNLFKI